MLPTPATFQLSNPPTSPSRYWLFESPFCTIRRSPPAQLVALIHAATVIPPVGLSCVALGAVTKAVDPSKLIAFLAIRPGTQVTVPLAVLWFALVEKSLT